MSDYSYRAYSPSKGNQSPTRRHPIIPPAGSAIGGGRYGGAAPPVGGPGFGDGFEGWYDGSLSYANTPGSNPSPLPPQHGVPPSLQPARGASGSRRDYDRDADLAFGNEPTVKRASQYSTATSDRGRDATYRRRVRTPSTSSTESIPRRSSRQDRERTPSVSPSRPIGISSRDGGTQRTPSGNIMNSLFTAENAAVVGSALGTAANFLGSRAGIIKPENQRQDDFDATPGGFNSRPVPDTVNHGNNDFNLGNTLSYLQGLTAPQTPPAAPPPQQPAGSPFTLSNALSYLQQQTSQQPNGTGTTSGGIPQRFTLAGIDIDLNWIAQKAGEQNPWVLLGGGVVAFWIISSIIATLMWYGIIAGILYVVYIVGVKNGGFNAIGGSPDRRRVGGPGGTGRPGGTGNTARRRY